MPDSLLEAYRGEPDSDGFPCPSRDLDADNIRAAELVRYLINDDLRPLADRAFGVMSAGLDSGEQEELLGRVTSTVTHHLVSELLHPDPKKSAKPRR